MKRRLLLLSITVIIVLAMLPAASLAYNSGSVTYNDHDYAALTELNCSQNQPAGLDVSNSKASGDNTGNLALILALFGLFGVPCIAAIVLRIMLKRWKTEHEVMPDSRAVILRRLVLAKDRKKDYKK